MVKDMTTGNPVKLLIEFSIPLFIGNIFQQFYSMVDTIIVGRFVSTQALAAVGATGALNYLILGFIWGATGGFSVLISQKFGAQNYKEMRNTIANGLYLSILLIILVTAFSMIFTRQLLYMMKTPEDIIDDAYIYSIIVFGGICFSMLYNFLSGTIRALGDSKSPLYFLIISSIVNIFLDLLFIICFKMGVAGAAIATVISQLNALILCIIYMKKRFTVLQFEKDDWIINKYIIKKLLLIGLPAGFQNSITAIGCVVLQSAVNSLGSIAVAAFTAGSKVEQIALQPIVSLSTAIATYTGQNLGANKIERIKNGVRKCIIITLIISIAFTVIMLPFGKNIISLFVGEYNKELFDLAQLYINIVCSCFCIASFLFIYRSTVQGLGNSFIPMIGGIFELIMRIVASLFLINFLGFSGLCTASPIAWLSAAILSVITYRITIKKLSY